MELLLITALLWDQIVKLYIRWHWTVILPEADLMVNREILTITKDLAV